MNKIGKAFMNLLVDILRSIGCIALLSPIILNWFIHGNEDRYRWILSGPYPFNSFGSGPFQLWIYVIIELTGIFLLILSALMKKMLRE